MKKVSLNALISKTKKYVFGDLLGNHSSKILGDGYDFAQISQYSFGQNIRRIDPYASAKSTTLCVREFFESKEVNLHVVVLASGSLHFGTKRLKQELIAEIVGLLGFSALKNSDSFSFSLLSDKILYNANANKSQNAIILNVKKVLEQDFIGQKLDAHFVSEYLLNQIKKRSLLFVVSDFFEEISLKAISKKHEVVALNIRDIFEENPQAIGNIDVLNPVSLQASEVVFEKNEIERYKKRLKMHDKKLGESLKKSAIKMIKIYTHENAFLKLEKAFKEL
jgi:uncharacterized protein (DUF58 family)